MRDPFTNDEDVPKIDLSKLDNLLTEMEIDMSEDLQPVAKKLAKGKNAPKEKIVAEKAEPRTREIPEGYVGLAQLAEEVGVSPASLRRKLRIMGVTKPEGSFAWAWKENSKDLNKLRKELAKGE